MRYYAKPPNRDDDGDYQGGDGGDVDSVADDDWDDTPSSRVAFTGGGEKFRLENFWQFAEIMGIKREYSLRVLSGKSLGEACSYGASYHTQSTFRSLQLLYTQYFYKEDTEGK